MSDSELSGDMVGLVKMVVRKEGPGVFRAVFRMDKSKGAAYIEGYGDEPAKAIEQARIALGERKAKK